MLNLIQKISDTLNGILIFLGVIYFFYVTFTGNHIPNDAWWMASAAFWVAYNAWSKINRTPNIK